MQQPKIIKQFQTKTGVWSLDELDQIVPDLVAAKKANAIAANISAEPIEV